MDAFATDSWANFLVAETGAAAALSGLLFVAVSINLARVLAYPVLASRAAESLALLIGGMVLCSLGLVPAQPRWALGGEYLLGGATMWVFASLHRLMKPRPAGADRIWKRIVPLLLGQAATLPIIVAGALLIAGNAGGFYWFAAGVVFAFLAAALNAWVLLVEIMR